MNDDRKQALTVLLAALIGLMVLGVVGYLAVWSPLAEAGGRVDAMLKENGEKSDELNRIRRDLPKLQVALRRSLPADPDARQEYDAVVNKILRDAKVPANSLSVKPLAFDEKAAPLLVGNSRRVYTRIGLSVELKRVDLATTLDVLRRYYQLNLLHQITKFSVKKLDDVAGGGGGSRRGSLYADRADLQVTFTTEALILDGAEKRRSLLPLSPGTGAVAGAAGLQMMLNSPEPTRSLTPLQLAPVLATAGRDYALALVKDVFHGPPPPVEPPAPPEEKPDTSPFIFLTSISRGDAGDGDAAKIEDRASAQEYRIYVDRGSAEGSVEVKKLYHTPRGVEKSYGPPEAELDISEATSSTARRFRVVGIEDNALIVAGRDGAAPAGRGGRRPGGGKQSPAKAKASAGADGEDAPPERLFSWRLGEPLSQIRELTGAEKARYAAAPAATAPAPPRAAKGADKGPAKGAEEDE